MASRGPLRATRPRSRPRTGPTWSRQGLPRKSPTSRRRAAARAGRGEATVAKSVLTNVRCFAVGIDLTGVSNKIELSSEAEVKKTTNYGSNGWDEVIGGIASAEISGEGQWEAGDTTKVDDASWAQLGGIGPWSVCPAGSAFIGDLAYFTNAMRSDYKLFDAVGEVAPWTGTAKSSWPLVRGVMMHLPGTPRTATGPGSPLELGAVLAGKRMYAALHVLSVAGTTPSLTARVEFDDNSRSEKT